MGSGPKISGKPHRNDWLHGWLIDNNIENESEAQKAAKSPQMLADLIDRAQAQNTEPIENFSGRSIAAGRSMDLTNYLSCGHPDCMTKQVDRLFSRVWHYFDKIAISGPDTHSFLEMVEECGEDSRKRHSGTQPSDISYPRNRGGRNGHVGFKATRLPSSLDGVRRS
jgi:hypothetical protein